MEAESGWSTFEAEQRRIRDTDSYKKTISYLIGLTEDKQFSDKIKRLRKKCGLPEDGIKEYTYITMPTNGHKVLSRPEHLDGSGHWDELLQLTDEYGLDTFWVELLEHYFIYNNFELDTMVFPIWISDINTELNGPFQYDDERIVATQTLQRLAKTHPVAVFIHPYASQREIVDYIKKLYRLSIKPVQEEYRKVGVRLGKIKKRSESVRKRNKFILANKHLPAIKIAGLVAQKFSQFLDYTYINKIISDHEKK